MINLILAVIMASFSKFENKEIENRMKLAQNQEFMFEQKNSNNIDSDGN